MPRRVIDRPGDTPGRSEFPLHVAEHLIAQAPAPSHNRANGRRPHAHLDKEEFFRAERAGLKPLEGVPLRGRQQELPVLWAYPAENFDYSNQNHYGKVNGKPPGPHRIITDRDKRIQGMVTHPVNDDKRFVQAPKRVEINYR
ncbi:hypothetical protein TMatcc_007886 [Talaromyces marneffei ATCC 18224]|nr:uncharacterized protein EYB26_004801 [Talaromyces marneffei]QGA17131.1 hypothetical protein EYB26_004801 [Talaromyces marneffei]